MNCPVWLKIVGVVVVGVTYSSPYAIAMRLENKQSYLRHVSPSACKNSKLTLLHFTVRDQGARTMRSRQPRGAHACTRGHGVHLALRVQGSLPQEETLIRRTQTCDQGNPEALTHAPMVKAYALKRLATTGGELRSCCASGCLDKTGMKAQRCYTLDWKPFSLTYIGGFQSKYLPMPLRLRAVDGDTAQHKYVRRGPKAEHAKHN